MAQVSGNAGGKSQLHNPIRRGSCNVLHNRKKPYPRIEEKWEGVHRHRSICSFRRGNLAGAGNIYQSLRLRWHGQRNPYYVSLVQGTDGQLYGTAASGGGNGLGTAYKITTAGAFTQLYSFCSQAGCADGGVPYAGLVMAANGNF